MEQDFDRTLFASMATDISHYFNQAFANTRLPGNTVRYVRMIVPDTISSFGGRQANYRIVLAPEDPYAGTLTIGTVYITKAVAELRTYSCLDQIHRRRFERSLELSEESYSHLIQEIRAFFHRQRYHITEEYTAPQYLPQASIETQKIATLSKRRLALLPLLIICIGLLILVFVFLWPKDF